MLMGDKDSAMDRKEAQQLLNAFLAATQSQERIYFANGCWIYPSEIVDFFTIVSCSNWLDREYLTARESKHLQDPVFIANASISELSSMLTALSRVERFSEGAWKIVFGNGVVERVMNRLVDLFGLS